ncbi:hypothetical protein FOB58_001966 [Candida parapsilosis]|uniref:Uncharacterized protein n=2 Tax=Candida parapsilosis TaxID=5480 RepID=G8BAD5_CANPC|nr:uncharacterized protein CPAR2_805570 [Candida parapsilosis]KAF6051906.1 hypothetical protein FOB58_001966 [Candida parapsilosis]KAF6052597.1 hypothetical protein FOB60_002853 [Candida parapsilosis]KAF6053708.1 hypothetical protein FOB59_001990 [Candida parapsilosis]KAF6064373.1 hypothetical protein FOB61_002799 [Candida parapsilosis]KAI5905653.1 uncharacterized protein K4G60_g4913 [Candida parapsilosis]
MPHEIYNKSLEDLSALEDQHKLKSFDSEVAWELGSLGRQLCQELYPNKGVVIDITLTSGQTLFHSAVSSGTASDNDNWVKRKYNTVFRFGKSSFYIGQKLRQKGKTIEEAMFVSSKDYASHGGSVPLRVESNEFVIGALTISGLAQEEDHLLALDILQQYGTKKA